MSGRSRPTGGQAGTGAGFVVSDGMFRMKGTVLIVLRLLAAIGGGYAVSAGLAAFASVGLPMITALPRSEAVVLASILAFLFLFPPG
jgi:hypothetical protein